MPCADPESSIRGGGVQLFFNLFFLDKGREDPNTTKSGHHQPASDWRAGDGSTLNTGLVALSFLGDPDVTVCYLRYFFSPFSLVPRGLVFYLDSIRYIFSPFSLVTGERLPNS